MRTTHAVINLDSIRHNAALAKNHAPGSQLVGVIKADAYGHGANEIARALNSICSVYAVAIIDEAISLQECGIQKNILVLQGFQSDDELHEIAHRNFWTMVHAPHQLEILKQYQGDPIAHICLKMDTGMHRLGLSSSAIIDNINTLKQNEKIEAISLSTHFSTSDAVDNANTQDQISLVRKIAQATDLPLNMANSGGIMAWYKSHAVWNRAGIMLYGVSPFETSHPLADQLKPAMSLYAPVIALREISAGDCVGYGRTWCAEGNSLIATLAIGYADGYPRAIKSGTPVFINKQKAPTVGTVSMDMITVDVTHIQNVKIGDMAELWGKNIPVNTVAKAADTIGYELLTRVAERVPRYYNEK